MNNIPKICTPVVGQSIEEFLDNLRKIQKLNDFIELRIDSIHGLRIEDILTIQNEVTKECICTLRSTSQGGQFVGDLNAFTTMMQYVCEVGFTYTDVEFAFYKEHKPKRHPQTKLILSHHFFNETPPESELNTIISEMESSEPDFVKVATYVNSHSDRDTLYRLITNKPPSSPRRIIVGMGELGKETRIIAPLLGSAWTYASTECATSAPGQIQLKELKSVYLLIANSII